MALHLIFTRLGGGVDLSDVVRDEWLLRCLCCGHLFDRPRTTHPGVALQFCTSRGCQRDREIRFGVGSEGGQSRGERVARNRRK